MPYKNTQLAQDAKKNARPEVCGIPGCKRYCAPGAAKCGKHLEAERMAQEATKKMLGLCLAVRCAVCGAIH